MSRLHPQLEGLRRDRVAAGARPLHELSVAEARAADAAAVRAAPREPLASVSDRSIPGPGGPLRIRFFLPEAGEPLPVLVWFFGGGWVLGSLDAADAVCRRLAVATPCAVAAVDYRLAPEHPFPAAVEDCDAATRWIPRHAAELGLDPTRVAVGGASAGANLAAAVTRLARERGGPALVLQLLVYPPTDFRADTPSRAEYVDPCFFDRDALAWCWSHYLAREADADDPLASPLRARDFSGLPPALVITAELDPLRDEAELYAERLAAAGVPTELVRYDGMVHGFFSLPDVADARAAQALAAGALGRAFEQAAARAGTADVLCEDRYAVARTLLIVDDHAGFRASARTLFESEGYVIVGEAEDGAAAVRLAGELRPEVVLLDVHLPDLHGFDVAELLRDLPDAPEVVLTSSRADYGSAVASTSARGFVAKDELTVRALEALLA